MQPSTKKIIIYAIAFWVYFALWLYVLFPYIDKCLAIQ